MTLPEDYLGYPHRTHGMDHDLYPWSNMFERPPVTWPGGRQIALWITVSVEYFPLIPNDGPFRAPGHMVTPYPDYRTYTTRDYGNRVGIYRILKVLDKLGLKASFPMNGVIAERYPGLLADIVGAGHEIIAHGVDMNSLHYGGMDPAVERDQIAKTTDILRQSSGQAITGWYSPARSQSENTLELLSEYGLDYMCDWVNDDLPYKMKNIISMPHTMELEDRHLLVTLGQSEAVYQEQILAAHDLFQSEKGGRVLHLSLTPYVIGQPWRIRTLEDTLKIILEKESSWSATGQEISTCWAEQQ